jgi:hypothetical protein
MNDYNFVELDGDIITIPQSQVAIEKAGRFQIVSGI